MTDNNIKDYIQKIIQPLYAKIQYLDNQNQQLKRRLSHLENQFISQNNKSYMKNTTSRQNHLESSKINRRDDDNRSMSGSKQKPGWKASTKKQQQKPPVVLDYSHHQKVKLKPPIPRMNSRTPTKTQQQSKRQKSPPPSQKKIIGGNKIQAEKIQITNNNKNFNLNNNQNIVSPRNTTQTVRQFDDPSASNVSKGSSIKLGKPNIYIQKESKLNSISSPRQSQLDRSSLTQKPVSGGSQVTQQNSSPKLAKSQLSINSDKKGVKVELQN